MSFCNHLRKRAQLIWNAQLTHPFVVALGKGTLPERKFRYYILQDARFLGDLARVFAAAAQRAPDAESTLRFSKLVEETILTERALHESYGNRWKLTPKEMSTVKMAPTNYAYTRHMLSVAQMGPPRKSLSWPCPAHGSIAWSAIICYATVRRRPGTPTATGSCYTPRRSLPRCNDGCGRRWTRGRRRQGQQRKNEWKRHS